MTQAERTKRLFLANLHKKEPDLEKLVEAVNGMIREEATKGHPGLNFCKFDVPGFERISDASMIHLVSYYKANGYYVHANSSFDTNDKLQIDEIFIFWVDLMSALDKRCFENI